MAQRSQTPPLSAAYRRIQNEAKRPATPRMTAVVVKMRNSRSPPERRSLSPAVSSANVQRRSLSPAGLGSVAFRFTEPRISASGGTAVSSSRSPEHSERYTPLGMADVIANDRRNPCVAMTARAGPRRVAEVLPPSSGGGNPSNVPPLNDIADHLKRQANSGVGFHMTTPRLSGERPLGHASVARPAFRTVKRDAVWQHNSPFAATSRQAPRHEAQHNAHLSSESHSTDTLWLTSSTMRTVRERLTVQHIVATVSRMSATEIGEHVSSLCGSSSRDARNVVFQFLREHFGLRGLVGSSMAKEPAVGGSASHLPKRVPPLSLQPEYVVRYVKGMERAATHEFLHSVQQECRRAVRSFKASLPVDATTEELAAKTTDVVVSTVHRVLSLEHRFTERDLVEVCARLSREMLRSMDQEDVQQREGS